MATTWKNANWIFLDMLKIRWRFPIVGPTTLCRVFATLRHVTLRGGSEAPRGDSEAPRGGSEAPRGGSEAPRGGSEAPRGGSEAPRGDSEAIV